MLDVARIEVLRSLGVEASSGQIILSRGDQAKAFLELENRRPGYEAARLQYLRYGLTEPRLVVFGGGRLRPNDPEFEFIKNLTRTLTRERNIHIVTGGGPGIMLAAHQGAELGRLEKAQSQDDQDSDTFSRNYAIDLTTLPSQERRDEHVDIRSEHAEFSTRLQEFLDIESAGNPAI